MGKLVHFEITSADSAGLADFYASTFNFETQASPFSPGYHLLQSSDGTSGAVMDRAYKDQSVILWFEVGSLDEQVRKVVASGGATAGERHTIPGQGHVQYVSDHEGNLVGLKQQL